ncbi:MAG: hypothetical protein CSA58_03420 [Micrococcales bacterium]|nr:MAG: hypothetical protein CSB46_10075 [Micrococcales bacterium]PIE27598.1 MAG: hypothetical protein CSA58_03420 [Micrococcales bacterium]
MIPSRQPHRFDAGGELVTIVLVEPSGPLGYRLAQTARHDAAGDLDDRLAGVRLPDSADAATLIDWSRTALALVTGKKPGETTHQVRPEVVGAQRFIDEHLHETAMLSDAAHHVALSARQLRRLFVADVGIPFRRYVLWRRVCRAVLTVQDGTDLTTAAATAGFADSAHFSRTFRKTFGLNPSQVLPLVSVAEADFLGQ